MVEVLDRVVRRLVGEGCGARSTAHTPGLFRPRVRCGRLARGGGTEGAVCGGVGVAPRAERELAFIFDGAVRSQQPVLPALFVPFHDVDRAGFARGETTMQHYKDRTGFECRSQSELPIRSQRRWRYSDEPL